MNVKSTSKTLLRRRWALFLLGLLIALAATIFSREVEVYSPGDQNAAEQGNNVARFNKNQYPIGDPASLWVVVNKGRKLSSGYVPGPLVAPDVPLRFSAKSPEMMLRADAASALKELFTAAEAQDLSLILASGYRSFSSQTTIYNRNLATDGQAATDALSARPGYSEHQTGLAVDVGSKTRRCEFQKCFGSLPEGQWMAANSYKYGFIVRYGQNKSDQTGYDYEPWHARYVGKQLAAELQKTGQTMEQFFGLPQFPDYAPEPLLL